MKSLKEEAESYFGVDIDHEQRKWDLTHSYDQRDLTQEYIRLYKRLASTESENNNRKYRR